MSDLIMVTFDGEETTGQSLATLRRVERDGGFSLDDTAVVVKNWAGAVRGRNGSI